MIFAMIFCAANSEIAMILNVPIRPHLFMVATKELMIG